jgi:hypothetical protein
MKAIPGFSKLHEAGSLAGWVGRWDLLLRNAGAPTSNVPATRLTAQNTCVIATRDDLRVLEIWWIRLAVVVVAPALDDAIFPQSACV